MICNYNHVVETWRKRNSIIQPLKEKLLQQFPGRAFANISHEDTITAFGATNISVLIDLTERAIKLTDYLLLELNDFMVTFPKYVKERINIKRLKSYGSVITYSNAGNKELLDLLEREPEADFNSVESLFGKPADEIKKYYETGYEDSF